MTQAAVLSPPLVKESENRHLLQFYQILGGAFFIALCAQIKIPLFFTPVPISLQTLAIMIIGGMLGRKNGALSAATYLVLLSVGLPVAAGGLSSPLALVGPTGGYLWGFIAQAYCVGWCVGKEKEFHPGRVFLAITLIWLMQLSLGTAWLGFYVGWDKAMLMGFYPFLLGGVLKCIAATSCLKKFRRV